jgi:hypothetical protein
LVGTCTVAMLLVLGATGFRLLLDQPASQRPSVVHETGRPAPSPVSPSASTLPDGFAPERLKPGERPPQFIVVGFDGAGWDEMWDFWFSIADRTPIRFTAFLSGTYLLSHESRTAYHPPYYSPGTSEIGWYDAPDVPVEIANLNEAVARGNEIGTHFNGHFCVGSGLPSGGNNWTTADWDTELDQFFSLLRHFRGNNHLPASTRLDVRPSDIHGSRTPCLEGLPERLDPALRAHGLDFDSSYSRDGLAWPLRQRRIWQIGMAVFPMHGTLPDGRKGVPATTMDYNFWFTQRGAVDASPDDAGRDSEQVLDTYRDMYAAAFHGNRAPLVLGNHFNDWNHNAYRDALAHFVLETCGRPETQCITYSDLIAWMEVQRPRVLERLQAQPPELAAP